MDLETSTPLMENSGLAINVYMISPHKVCVYVCVGLHDLLDIIGHISYVTQCFLGNYTLRINMEDFEGNQRYAEYKNFKVDDEKVKQRHKIKNVNSMRK